MAIPQSRRLDSSEIPVIDLAALIDGPSGKVDSTIGAIQQACSEIGFMYVRNHGVSREIVDGMDRAARSFFSAPEEKKLEATMAQSHQFRGYLPFKSGGTKAAGNLREGYIIRADRPLSPDEPMDGPNIWPSDKPEFKQAMLDYFVAMDRLSRTMIPAFAQALDLPRDYLDPFFARSMTQMKLNYYPAQEAPEKENEIGVFGHADCGGFTILWQDDTGGLEVLDKHGEWVVAPPIADTFVINIGDILQAWSGGRFPSTPHRVINRYGTDRHSTATFVNPNFHTVVKPLVGTTTSDFEPFVSGEYQVAVFEKLYPRAAV